MHARLDESVPVDCLPLGDAPTIGFLVCKSVDVRPGRTRKKDRPPIEGSLFVLESRKGDGHPPPDSPDLRVAAAAVPLQPGNGHGPVPGSADLAERSRQRGHGGNDEDLEPVVDRVAAEGKSRDDFNPRNVFAGLDESVSVHCLPLGTRLSMAFVFASP